MKTPRPPLRLVLRLLLAALLTAGTLLLAALLLMGLCGSWAAARSGPATVDDLMTLAAAGGGLLCLTWLIVSALLMAASQLPGRAGAALARLSERITPALLRRLAAALLGGAAVLPVGVGTAQAATTQSSTPADPAASGVHPVSARTNSVALSHLSLDRPAASTGTVTVEPGDSLWRIAASSLPPDAPAADVARTWPRWHAANRTTIGPDPDRIHPGQVLTPPELDQPFPQTHTEEPR